MKCPTCGRPVEGPGTCVVCTETSPFRRFWPASGVLRLATPVAFAFFALIVGFVLFGTVGAAFWSGDAHEAVEQYLEAVGVNDWSRALEAHSAYFGESFVPDDCDCAPLPATFVGMITSREQDAWQELSESAIRSNGELVRWKPQTDRVEFWWRMGGPAWGVGYDLVYTVTYEHFQMEELFVVFKPIGGDFQIAYHTMGEPDESNGARLTREVLRRRCESGHGKSCFNLGLMWGNGEDGPPNLGRSREWVSMACDAGHEEACAFLPQMKGP